MSSTAGDWTDKMESFPAKFEDMVISDLQDQNLNVFVFLDVEILNANLATLQ
jgi:hypothetical protein